MSRSRKSIKYPSEGDVLVGYKIGRTLGQGAFGKVKLATRTHDKDDTKVKLRYTYEHHLVLIFFCLSTCNCMLVCCQVY